MADENEDFEDEDGAEEEGKKKGPAGTALKASTHQHEQARSKQASRQHSSHQQTE